MTRRTLLLAAGALAAGAFRLRADAADAADEVWDLMGSLASGLANGNISQFMSAFDDAMPGIEELRTNVTALVRELSVQSTLDPVKNEGDDRNRTVEVDWLLILVDRDNDAAATRRQQRVSCLLVKRGRRWRITAFDPPGMFTLPARPGRQEQK